MLRVSPHAVFDLMRCRKVPVHMIIGYIYLCVSGKTAIFLNKSISVYLFACERDDLLLYLTVGELNLSVPFRKVDIHDPSSLSNTKYVCSHTKSSVRVNMSFVLTWEKLW